METPDPNAAPRESAPTPATSSEPAPAETTHKRSKKEIVVDELREILFIVIYLAVTFSILATFRCLVLIQVGINDFAHSYLVAGVESLALGKIVVIGQKMRVLKKFNSIPVAWAIICKSAIMTVLVELASKAEEKFLSHALHNQTPAHPELLLISHTIALMCIFMVLFAVRDLDDMLGEGTIYRVFFSPRKQIPVTRNPA